MRVWPLRPVIHEINTWVWLHELGEKYGKRVDLASVPGQEWDAIAAAGLDAVWFMGVWERSPAGAAISMANAGLLEDFRRALPDFKPEDNVGSPYCVRRYVVDARLGGPKGLVVARQSLAQRGLRLLLDFVPNHVAPDHPWVTSHPEYFIQGDQGDLRADPTSFVAIGRKVLACGRDPFFPAWPDVVQLNAFDPDLREATLATLLEIAAQCDGVRCDMAMLLMNDVFERTWGPRAGERPARDYWPTLIPAVRSRHPGFRFLAEAYWDLEWALQRQGFDFCYDKKLYDRMTQGDTESLRLHLAAEDSYQRGLVRFLENHDEPRAAATFPPGKARAAALAMLTLPGAKLLHEGQFEGRRVHLPVFLRRRPPEPIDRDLADFYGRLLRETRRDVFRNGRWHLCERTGWPDNPSHLNILAWSMEKGDERYLIVLNFSETPSQARVRLSLEHLPGRTWTLSDPLSGECFERSGDDLEGSGLFISLEAWCWHFLRLEAVP